MNVKTIKTAFLTAALLTIPMAYAETSALSSVAVDVSHLPTRSRPAGTVSHLAQDGERSSMALVRSLSKGEATPAHQPGRNDVRLAIVIEGTIFHGIGETVDPERETAYTPGDVLLLSPSDTYWIAARENDARLLIVFLDEGSLHPSALEMMR